MFKFLSTLLFRKKEDHRVTPEMEAKRLSNKVLDACSGGGKASSTIRIGRR